MLLTENNDAIDDGPLFITPMVLDANTLKVKMIFAVTIHCMFRLKI